MDAQTAISLIEAIVYKPGYRLVGESFEHRFEGTVKVTVSYDAPNYNREHAPNYTVPAPNPSAAFHITVADFHNDVDLYRCLLERLLKVEEHEAREAFRVAPTNWAPFHPHKVDGMKRWGDPQSDYLFGLA